MPTKAIATVPDKICFAVVWASLALFSSWVVPHVNGQEPTAETLIARRCWQYQTSGLDTWQAANDGSNVYVAERGGRISAISADDGKRIWSTELGADIRSNLVVSGRSLHVVTGTIKGSLELRSLSIVSGIAGNSIPMEGNGSVQLSATRDRIITVTSNGDISAMDTSGEKMLWSNSLGDSPAVATVGKDELAVGFNAGRIAIINASTGVSTYAFTIKFRPTAILVYHDTLLVGDDRGNLTKLERLKSRAEWNFKSGGSISGIYPVDESGLLVTSFDNFVYRIEASNGHVVWKLRQLARVADTVLLGLNTAAITPIGEPVTVIVDINHGKQIGQIDMPEKSRAVQPAIYLGNSFIAFTSEGLISNGIGGCRAYEKAEAKASAFN